MIFALFFLQSISIAFGTVTNVHDVETVISSYLLHTIDQHTLHATSSKYMQIVQDESHLASRYFQSVRYIKHGFPMHTNSSSHTNSTNDIVYKKLNFVQSIAYYYCGINMSSVVHPSLDNILIDESQLYMNSTIFPIQLVESYELVRSEICERIKQGLYKSVVNMFKPESFFSDYSFFPGVVRNVSNFISFGTDEVFLLDTVGFMYPFLVKFGEYELYKDSVFQHLWQMDDFSADALVDEVEMDGKIAICVNQIQHPKMYKYATSVLNLTGDDNTSDFWYYVRMYQLSTGKNPLNRYHQVEDNNNITVRNVLQLIDECRLIGRTVLTHITTGDCSLIALRIHEFRDDGVNGHEYVLDAIKCAMSNHDLHCSKFANETSTDKLRKLLSVSVLYPYFNEIMNDNQFVNIVNNNINSQIDTYLQGILTKLMMVALEQYKDIEMIKQISTVFKPKINVYTNCILFENEYPLDSRKLSWMDVLNTYGCRYLTKYFRQIFSH